MSSMSPRRRVASAVIVLFVAALGAGFGSATAQMQTTPTPPPVTSSASSVPVPATGDPVESAPASPSPTAQASTPTVQASTPAAAPTSPAATPTPVALAPAAAAATAVPHIEYAAHVQNIGWQTDVEDGATAGTTGRSLRMEAIRINLAGSDVAGGVEYAAHVQNIGWQAAVTNGAVAGTTGKALRMEAITISLTGAIGDQYDVYYRAHVQNIGWMGWASDGAPAGTTGLTLRMEAIQIVLVAKGGQAPGTTAQSYLYAPPQIDYQAHVENIGWQAGVSNGAIAGTVGKALRMEALKVSLADLPEGVDGGVQYQAYVQNTGWQAGVTDGAIAGTVGKALRMEAVKLSLTGGIAASFDICYQVQVQNLGWLSWTCNGQTAGTSGLAYRMEAIRIKLVSKATPIASAPTQAYYYRSGTTWHMPPGTFPVGTGTYTFGSDGQPFEVMLHAGTVNQNAIGAYQGCEIVAMYNGLTALSATKGQSVTAMLSAFPRSSNPNQGYVGDPFSQAAPGFPTMASYQVWPPAVAAFADGYAAGSKDISGASMATFQSYVMQGMPVMFWGTINLAAPKVVSTSYYGRTLLGNSHTLLIDGYNARTGQFHIDDSISGQYWTSVNTVSSVNASNNSFAVLLSP